MAKFHVPRADLSFVDGNSINRAVCVLRINFKIPMAMGDSAQTAYSAPQILPSATTKKSHTPLVRAIKLRSARVHCGTAVYISLGTPGRKALATWKTRARQSRYAVTTCACRLSSATWTISARVRQYTWNTNCPWTPQNHILVSFAICTKILLVAGQKFVKHKCA